MKGTIWTRQEFSQPRVMPPDPIHRSLDAFSSSGIATVSNGTISVARRMVSARSRPFHCTNANANAAAEHSASEQITVTPVTRTELKTNSPTRARLNASW